MHTLEIKTINAVQKDEYVQELKSIGADEDRTDSALKVSERELRNFYKLTNVLYS